MAARSKPNENLSVLGYLVRFEPERARATITTAFIECKGVGVEAADRLGISYRNLTRVVARLDIGAAIDAECEKRGFPRHQGRPRAAKRKAKR